MTDGRSYPSSPSFLSVSIRNPNYRGRKNSPYYPRKRTKNIKNKDLKKQRLKKQRLKKQRLKKTKT